MLVHEASLDASLPKPLCSKAITVVCFMPYGPSPASLAYSNINRGNMIQSTQLPYAWVIPLRALRHKRVHWQYICRLMRIICTLF
jgi:hypothetical protein